MAIKFLNTVSVDTDALYVDAANNRVGIGINNPTADLHVQGSSATDVPIIRSGGYGNSGSKLELAETLTNGDMNYGFSFFNDGNSSNTLMIKAHNNSTTGTTAITIGRTNALTTFSTVPIVGTRTAGDNSTYAASTAFVTAAVAAAPQGDITAVTAGTGLTGGGTSGAVTLNAIGGDGITANANDLAVDSTVVRTTGAQTIGGVKLFSTYIGMQADHYVNYRFQMIENATPQYILLCRNTSNNDINGVIRMDRTSGNWQSASVEVIVSAGSGAMYGGTLRTLQVTQSSEDYRLISCTYNSISYIAIKYSGNSYPETSGAYFTGRANISAGTLFQVVSSGVSNEASFGGTTESYNEVDSFVISGDVTATANYTAGNSKIIYKAQRSGGAVAGDWSYDDATTDMSLGTSTAHSFSLKTGNTRALTINNSQNATFAGDVGLGGTGLYTNTASLNIDGTGLAIKNDTAGSSNNWSTIKNTATASRANLVFTTGAGTSLTLNHDMSATFAESINVSGSIAADDYIMLEGTTNPYLVIQDTTNEKYLHLVSSDNESALLYSQDTFKISSGLDFANQTPRLTINSSGNATFAGDVYVGDFNTTGTSAVNIRAAGEHDSKLGLFESNLNHGFSLNYDGGLNQFLLKRHDNSSSGTTVLSLSRLNNNATFAGNVTLNGTDGHINLDGNNAVIFDNSNNNNAWYIRNGGSNSATLQMGTGSSPGSNIKLTLDGSGNVGIGTTNPSNTLDVNGGAEINGETYIRSTSNVGLRIQTTDQGIGGNDGLRVGLNGTHAFVWNYENLPLSFGTNGSQKATILANGNVGIGTTSPNEKLQVAGNIHAYAPSGIDAGLFASTAAGSTTIAIRSSGITHFNGGNVGIGTTSPLGRLQINEYSVALQGNQTQHGELSVFANSGDESLFLGVKNAQYPNRGWAFNTVTNGVNSDLQIKEHGATSVRMTLESGGNVGIGTTSPQQKLHVNDGGIRVEKLGTGLGGFISIGNGTEQAGNYSAYFFGNTASDNNYFKGGIAYETLASTYGRGDMHFLQNSTTSNGIANISDSVMTILNGGNVGIGTTSPGEKLSVDGNIKIEGSNSLFFGGSATVPAWGINNSGSNLIINDQATTSGDVLFTNDGNVGIGTTNPAAKLDVVRNVASYAVNLGDTDARASLKLKSSSNGDGQLTVSQGGSSSQIIQGSNAAGTSAVNININPFGGNVGIGTTSPGYKLDVSGTGRFTSTVTATNFILSSDKRKKTKIKDLICDNIDVNWKSFELKENEGEYRTGVIAQELEEVHPEFVNTDKEGFKSVKYIDLLIAKIAELEARLEKLEK